MACVGTSNTSYDIIEEKFSFTIAMGNWIFKTKQEMLKFNMKETVTLPKNS